jgi:hypothetical protein
MKINTFKNREMFHRAWKTQIGFNPLTLEESRKRWKAEFGCDMIIDARGRYFKYAVFDSEKEATAFILRWS